MFMRKVRLLVGCLAISILVIPAARAQWAVIDVGAIVQLVQEVQEMEQEIAVAKSQLQQAEQALQSMSGNRGMQNLPMVDIPRSQAMCKAQLRLTPFYLHSAWP